MNQSKKDQTYWTGWYFAYALLGLMFIGAVCYGQFDKLCPAPQPSWLPWSQPEEHCFRDWIAALSGWVGFAAAAVGAYFVFHQLDQQRKQTAFMIGDGEPTVDLVCAPFANLSAGFRIVNWNRRVMVVESIKITSPHIDAKPLFLRRLPGNESLDDGDFRPKFDLKARMKADWRPAGYPDLPGWVDHSLAPSAAVYFLEFDGDLDPSIFGTEATENMEVTIKMFTPGDPDDDYTVVVTGARGNVAPRVAGMFSEEDE
ncbi:hypothetical protein [Rhizobium rhizogenes]|uniref:hypothetical protein n=1 Tax=Rhizobium rhizogenes TaxID=359 RepID=UPI00157167C2|nr:hypothetical protein [Rhizobium rhizogenes]NTG09247.1 hypothetical protein [Rhizobium rhizogenes]